MKGRNTRWIYNNENRNIKNSKKYSKDLLAILASRGLTEEKDIEKFLNCDLKDLRDPFDLKDMEKTIDYILEKRKNNENIWIYGDYDVDGITSTSLLYLAFKEIGIEANYYIPLRDEGYGLNKEAIKEISDNGGDLIITVDCGISSVEEVQYANELRVDVIITDHHEINNDLPNAYTVINCKREDNIYDFKYLAGVGTAFMLILALYKKLNIEESAYKYLDICAIGTVADLVPLIEDNRIIVKRGLEILKKTKWNGLQNLIRKLFPDFREKTYDTYDIGFIIAPVFNAAGRLEDAKMGVELFTSDDNKICDQTSYKLMEKNSERKTLQSDIYDSAIEEIEEKKLYNKNVIVVAKENFHHGVIGIVASKVIDVYYKPAIIMEIKKDRGIATASCRSIEGFNIIEALNSMKELFTKYGGHAGAAGFSIPIENIEIFEKRMDEYIEKNLDKKYFYKPIKIEKNIQLQKVSYDFLKEIEKLKPFGFGNPTPAFAMTNCSHSNLRKIGKDKSHLMLNLIKNNIEIKNCVWFGAADMFNYIENNTIDVAFKLKLETFRNKFQYKIFIEDVKHSDENEFVSDRNIDEELLEDIDIYDTKFPIETVFYTRRKISDDLKLKYGGPLIYITDKKITVGNLDEVTSYLLLKLKENYGYNFKIEVIKSIQTDENYNVYIKIHRDYNFETFKIKSSEIFIDIKNHLIGKFPYNSFEKKVLANVFKSKNSVTAIYKEDRGVGTICKTIGLFYKTNGKKILFVVNNQNSIPDTMKYYGDISSDFIDGYDFYIFFDINQENYPDKSLVFIKDDPKNKNRDIVTDDFKLPDNVIITDENTLVTKEFVYTKKMNLNKRINIIKNLKSLKTIYATKDIKEIL